MNKQTKINNQKLQKKMKMQNFGMKMHFALKKKKERKIYSRLNRTFVFVLFRNLNQLDIDFCFSLKVDTNAFSFNRL